MAKTRAEIQRAYRDRKRGGPPKGRGRWANHRSAADIAKQFGISRSTYYRMRVINRWYPELEKDLRAEKMSISAAYQLAVRKRDMEIAKEFFGDS